MTPVTFASTAFLPARPRSPTPVMVSVGATAPPQTIVFGSDLFVITYTDPDGEVVRLAHEAMAEPGGESWDEVKQAFGL